MVSLLDEAEWVEGGVLDRVVTVLVVVGPTGGTWMFNAVVAYEGCLLLAMVCFWALESIDTCFECPGVFPVG